MPAATFTLNVTGTVTHKFVGLPAGVGADGLGALETRIMAVFKDELSKVKAATDAGVADIKAAVTAALNRVDEDFNQLKTEFNDFKTKVSAGTVTPQDEADVDALVAEIQSNVADVVNALAAVDPNPGFPVKGAGSETVVAGNGTDTVAAGGGADAPPDQTAPPAA